MKKSLFFFALLLIAAFSANAQIKTPAPSPTATLQQVVGLTDVEVVYSRPSMKERTIFAADGLVPYGNLWRTGANAATKITFSDDVKLAGKEVKAGSYAVLTKPMADKWEFRLYSYNKRYWTEYKSQTPAVTFFANTNKTGRMVESFTIDINNFRDESANIEFMWADTYVSVPMTVDADSKVMKDIEIAIAGTTAGEYYNAGSYYHKAGKDINKAYEWVHKANEMNEKAGSPKYWQLRREALILADMNRLGDAIQVASISKELAEEADNQDYVRMNEKSIAEWTKAAQIKGKKAPVNVNKVKSAKM